MKRPKVPFTKAVQILQFGNDRNKWAYAAREIKTAQTALLRRTGKRGFDDIGPVWGWVTDTGRPLGVGHCAKSQGRKGERVARIELPFHGSGVNLREEAEGHIRRHTAAKKRGNFQVVKAAA